MTHYTFSVNPQFQNPAERAHWFPAIPSRSRFVSLVRLLVPFTLIMAASGALSSCATNPRSPLTAPVTTPERVSPPPVPELIMGNGFASADRLSSFVLANNSDLNPARARLIAELYLEESRAEGVNADVAFAQMCVETGFLKFGGSVSADMNNYCGLGSIGSGQPGLTFPDERTGVRAHVQHLKAYGSAEPLAGVPVDPRYRYVVPKGKAPTIAGLSETWASDPAYAAKIRSMLERLYAGS